MQTHAKFFSWHTFVWGEPGNQATVGTQSIISETPPTNLHCLELAHPWEAFLDSLICLTEAWVYDGLCLALIFDKYCRKLDFTVEGSQLQTCEDRCTRMYADTRWCTQQLSVKHSLPCAKGGFTSIRHNEICNLTATLITEVCHNVCIESGLQQPVSNETIQPTIKMVLG